MGAAASIAHADIAHWTTDHTCALVAQVLQQVEAQFRACEVDGHRIQRMTDAKAVAKILKVPLVHAASIAEYIKDLLAAAQPPGAAAGAKVYEKSALGNAYQPHVDDFAMETRLGKGAFGDVWQGAHVKTGVRYALKIFDKAHVKETDSIDFVVREQKLLALLHEPQACPFLVQIHFAFQDQRKMYMALTLATGGELYQNMQAMPHNRFNIETARFYIAEIMLAIEWMHSKRVVHRDLKAENVIITGDGHVLVADFGLAKEWDQGQTDLHSTSMIGTPSYMPPEVIRESPHGVGFDFWALGVLLFEMVVGRTPFAPADSDDAHGLFVNILMHAPRFPDGWGGSLDEERPLDEEIPRARGGNPPPELEPRLPEEARSIIEGLLTKNPDSRLGSAASGGWAALKAQPFFSRRSPALPAVKGAARGGGSGVGDPVWALPSFEWGAAEVLQMKPPRMPPRTLASDTIDQGAVSDDDWEDMPAFETYVARARDEPNDDDGTPATDEPTTQRAAAPAGSTPALPCDVRSRSGSMTPDEAGYLHDLEQRHALLAGEVSSIGKKLESRERALEVVLNLVPQMICAKDADGKYIIANKKMAALYGLSPSELEGKNQLDVAQSAAEAKAMLAVDQQVIADGRESSSTLVLKQEFGGTRLAPKTMKIRKFPYIQPENGEPAVMAIGEDISEFIEKEKRVKEKLETLQLANSKLKTEKAMLEHKCKMYQGLNRPAEQQPVWEQQHGRRLFVE
jgi:PAS domain S-box-containing protein